MRGTHEKEFIAIIAAILASGGNHPPVNAVAKAKLLLEEVDKQFPDEREKPLDRVEYATDEPEKDGE